MSKNRRKTKWHKIKKETSNNLQKNPKEQMRIFSLEKTDKK